MAYIYPASFGVTDDTNEDNNHCALRAYCNVTGESFKDAQIIFAKQGRKYKKGTQFLALHKVYTNAGMTATLMGSTRLTTYLEYISGKKSTSPALTLKKLLDDPKYSKGKYILCTKGHAFSVIDGKIVDTIVNKTTARIYVVYSYEQV